MAADPPRQTGNWSKMSRKGGPRAGGPPNFRGSRPGGTGFKPNQGLRRSGGKRGG